MIVAKLCNIVEFNRDLLENEWDNLSKLAYQGSSTRERS